MMNYELGRDENAPWWEKSIGRGVVQRAGEDFFLKLIHFNHLYPILGLPSSVHSSHLNQERIISNGGDLLSQIGEDERFA